MYTCPPLPAIYNDAIYSDNENYVEYEFKNITKMLHELSEKVYKNQ